MTVMVFYFVFAHLYIPNGIDGNVPNINQFQLQMEICMITKYV